MLTDMWELHFVEFEKFRKQPFDIREPLQRWLRYMDERTSSGQLEELMSMDPLIRMAEERLTALSADEETRVLYEAREKAIRDQNSLVFAARKEGRQEGERVGEEKGLQKGLQQGVETVARNMLSEGADEALVSRFTGLSK